MIRPQVFKVVDNVYCIRRPSYLSCSYLVITRAGVAFVDAGMKSDGSDLLYALRRVGYEYSAVHAVLLTHWHNDHTAGTRAIQEMTGARVYFHPSEEPFMKRRTASTGVRGRIAALAPEAGPFVLVKGLFGSAVPRAVGAYEAVVGGETLEGEFDVIATPGHTEGHLSFLHRPTKVLFAGDALAVKLGKLGFMSRPVTPDLATSWQSMRELMRADFRVVCPGHQRPLAAGVEAERARLARYLEDETHWPLLG